MDDDTKSIAAFGAVFVFALISLIVADTLPDYLIQAKCIEQRGNWVSNTCAFEDHSE